MGRLFPPAIDVDHVHCCNVGESSSSDSDDPNLGVIYSGTLREALRSIIQSAPSWKYVEVHVKPLPDYYRAL